MRLRVALAAALAVAGALAALAWLTLTPAPALARGPRAVEVPATLRKNQDREVAEILTQVLCRSAFILEREVLKAVPDFGLGDPASSSLRRYASAKRGDRCERHDKDRFHGFAPNHYANRILLPHLIRCTTAA